MTTLGSFLRNSASSPAVIRTSVMAGLSCFVVAGWGRSEIPLVLVAGQHLAKLLGGGRDDGDEIGLAKPALRTMALQVTARAAMEHRRMRGCDTGVAEPQTQRDDASPIAVVGIIGIARQRHRLLLELGMELAELRRLLRQIAVDVAEWRPDLIHDADAILDQAEPHAGLQQDEAGADFLHELPGLFGQDQFIRHE